MTRNQKTWFKKKRLGLREEYSKVVLRKFYLWYLKKNPTSTHEDIDDRSVQQTHSFFNQKNNNDSNCS